MASGHIKQISFKYRFPTWNHQQGAERKLQFSLTPDSGCLRVWLRSAWIRWTRCCWWRQRDTERAMGGKEVTLTSFSLTANEQRAHENRQPACCHDCATVVRLFAGWRGSCCPVAAPSGFQINWIYETSPPGSVISASETIPHNPNAKLNLQTS